MARKPTRYNLNIKYKGSVFCIAKIGINNTNGDIYYHPYTHSKDSNAVNSLDHISFHKDGRVHLANVNGSKHILQQGVGKGGRQEIVKTGYQLLLVQTISDFTKLPLLKKEDIEDSDEAFVLESVFPVKLRFSLISGKLIVANKATAVSNKEEPRILEVKNRALGNDSGNGDKLLQYTLLVNEEVLPENKSAIDIPDSFEISNEV